MSKLQWCLPLVQGRGAGLGNELVPWARAYLMAQVLQAKCLSPAFGMNIRGYRKHFGTSRIDWVTHRTMFACLPSVKFDEAAYQAYGAGDVVESFSRFATDKRLFDRSPCVITTDGMWGGIQHIVRAHEFVRASLYGSRYARANLASLSARLDPKKITVAMHVRLGDFSVENNDINSYRGKFNCALPLSWFINLGKNLKKKFGDLLQFQIFSDGSQEQLAPLVTLLSPVRTDCQFPSDISDLLAMSQADLLVCSVSSYSVWAAALSKAPYIWFSPQLYNHGNGALSIWGHEAGQHRPGSPTQLALDEQLTTGNGEDSGRAFTADFSGDLSLRLIERLHTIIDFHRSSGDLVRYGVVLEGVSNR